MAEHHRSDFKGDLWTSPSSPAERRSIGLALAAYGLAVVALLPWARQAGPQIPGSVAIFTTAIIVADLTSGLVLLSQLRQAGRVTQALTAAAFLFSGVFAIGHLVTFPGAVMAVDPMIGGPQLASYTYLVWRLGFGLLMLAAGLAGPMTIKGGVARWAPIGAVALAIALFGFLMAFENRLPVLVEGGRFNRLDLVISWTTTAVGAAACAVTGWRSRRGPVVNLWLAIALTTFCGDLALSNIAGARFTWGWYGARLSGCVSAGVLLVFFFLRLERQQRAARDAAVALHSALTERTLFAELLDTTDALVQVSDFDYRWLAINQASAAAFERIFGVRPQVGQSMLDVLADKPEHQAAVRAVWSRALSGEAFSETAEFGDPALERRVYEMNYRPLRDEEGQRIGAYQFVFDVTDRVREQEKLAEAETALRQAQKMETVGQLTGGVAHDFKNLLTPIVGALDLLRRQIPDEPRSQRLLDGALQSAERARVLIQRLMAFARRQRLDPRPVDVADMIESMRDLLTHSLGPQIALRLDVPASLPPARVDPNQFELALLNLAVNARDAMSGEGMLTIRGELEQGQDQEGAPGFISISVIDTGAGMDAATLARAIEPFFTTKEIGRGTGLGLSMVHGFAAQLGGQLMLRSAPGEGTTAILRLPTSNEPVLSRETGPTPVAIRRPPEGVSILLVDDEPLVRAATAEMAGVLGYTVVEASSGTEALGLIRNGLRPTILVTDYAMPSMTGEALAREARHLAPSLAVLVITGFDTPFSHVPHNLPRLVKPFRQADLASSLDDLLRNAQVDRG